MRSAVASIIGCNGKYGRALVQFCQSLIPTGLVTDVHGADIGTALSNVQAVELADVVIVAVSPRATVDVIREITPALRADQLIMDVTSRKVLTVQAMLESAAEVRGLHPMCAPPPSGSWRGQTIADCPVRVHEWREWSDAWLAATGARLKVCTPEHHDRHGDIVQRLTHAAALVQAVVVRREGVSIEECLEFASPVYRVALSLIGRILAQDPKLYYDIQTLDPGMINVLQAMVEEAAYFHEMVKDGNEDGFIAEFIASRNHFGAAVIRENFELFELLTQLMIDHCSTDRVLLEIPPAGNHPGALHHMTGIFLAHGIDVKSLRSFYVGAAVRMELIFDKSPNADEVQRALLAITSQGLATVV